MGKITVVINDELEDKFRRAAAELFGFKRGNFTKAIEKAMEDFLPAAEGKGGKSPAASSWREKKGKNPSQ
jgi:hypothetical protein